MLCLRGYQAIIIIINKEWICYKEEKYKFLDKKVHSEAKEWEGNMDMDQKRLSEEKSWGIINGGLGWNIADKLGEGECW